MIRLIFFLSGLSALVFETLFFHLSGLMMGSSLSGTVIVLSSFMFGMAAGNGLAACYGGGIRRPARVYFVLETIIAISGAGLIIIFFRSSGLLTPIFGLVADQPPLLHLTRASVAVAVQLIPATAMGATLPVMVRAAHRRETAFGSTLGSLYGWNTLGAVAGVLAGEILMVRILGIIGAAVAAGLISLTAAVLALSIDRRQTCESLPSSDGGGTGVRTLVPRGSLPLLACSFVAGLVLMALEVIWFRFLLLFFYPTGMNFAVMLAVVLAGIGSGGLAASSLFRRTRNFQNLLVPALLLGGAFVILCYRFCFPAIVIAGFLGRFALSVTVVLMFPVSFLSGVIFTILGHALHGILGRETEATGMLIMANTIGAVAGPLIARFVFLPGLGVEISFLVLAAVYAAAALALLPLRSLRPIFVAAGRENRPPPSASPPAHSVTSRGKWWYAAALLGSSVLLLLALVTFPFGEQKRFLDLSNLSFSQWGERRVAYRETPVDSIQMLRKDLLGEPRYYRMVTDSYSMSTTMLQAKRYMKLFVYLPAAVSPDPQDALLVGYGCGNTARALLDTRSVRSIDAVDISPGLLDASGLIYASPEENPLNDPRVTVHIEDARFFLMTTGETYDLITGEPPPPKASTVVNLYTREFFSLVRDRLSPRGVVTYWLPVDQLLRDESRAIIRSFCDVFEDCSLWSGSETQWIMMGTRGASMPLTEDAFGRQWEDPVAGPEMRALGLPGPEQFGSLFIADGPRLKNWLGDAPALTDNYPWRLSPWGPPSEEDRRAYRELADPEGSRESFLEGRGVSSRWPAALRRESGTHFEVREAVNGLLDGPSPSLLQSCLSNPLLEGYLSWAFRSDAAAQQILSRAGMKRIEAAPPDPELFLHLAAQSAERKDYATAAEYLRAAGTAPGWSNRRQPFSPEQLMEMQIILLQASLDN